MGRRTGLWLALSVAVVGCATQRLTVEELRQTYDLGWDGSIEPDGTMRCGQGFYRPLVQLGLPGRDRLVVWYAQEGCDRAARRVAAPRVWLDGAEVARTCEADLECVHLAEVGVGRIEIPGLEADATHELVVSLGEGHRSQPLRARTAPAANAPFSFLVWSCFQPYADEGGRARVYRRTQHVLERLREVAGGVSAPSFGVALGDQLYLDAGAYKRGPRSLFWGMQSQKSRMAEPDRHYDYLDEAYRRHFAIPGMDATLASVPVVMTWDDHEIRDGWGSHKDETRAGGGVWMPWLSAARAAYIGWQVLRGPGLGPSEVAAGPAGVRQLRPVPAEAPTRAPEIVQRFEWGPRTSVFLMDLRSLRDSRERRLIGRPQIHALERWLDDAEGQGPRLMVLGLSVPLSHEFTTAEDLQWILPLRHDDLRDMWTSEENLPFRAGLLRRLRRHFEANPLQRLLLLGGDVHFGELSLLGRTRAAGPPALFGWELVSSGLAQASYFPTLREASHAITAEGVVSVGLGRLHAPHFAEVLVSFEDSDEAPPTVRFAFHPAEDRDGRHLVNLRAAADVRREGVAFDRWLDADQAQAESERFFQRFIRDTDPEPGAGKAPITSW